MNSYIIKTARLGLRKWIPADYLPFAKMNCDPEVMRYFANVLTERQSHEMIDRIGQQFIAHSWGLYAVELLETRTFIGFTGFSIPRFESYFTPCVEIGWRYAKAAWGKGLATEAAAACLVYGFNSLGFDRIVSFTSEINECSIQVMQRIGMDFVGEFMHPNIDRGHVLCKHVLYDIKRPVAGIQGS